MFVDCGGVWFAPLGLAASVLWVGFFRFSFRWVLVGVVGGFGYSGLAGGLRWWWFLWLGGLVFLCVSVSVC